MDSLDREVMKGDRDRLASALRSVAIAPKFPRDMPSDFEFALVVGKFFHDGRAYNSTILLSLQCPKSSSFGPLSIARNRREQILPLCFEVGLGLTGKAEHHFRIAVNGECRLAVVLPPLSSD